MIVTRELLWWNICWGELDDVNLKQSGEVFLMLENNYIWESERKKEPLKQNMGSLKVHELNRFFEA